MKYTFFCKNRKFVSALFVMILGVLLCMGAKLQVRYEVALFTLPCTFPNMKFVEHVKDTMANVENNVKTLRIAEYNKEALALYEAYFAMEMVEWDYLYAYYDCDGDGKLELLLKHSESDKVASDIMKYENNGLLDIYEWGMEKNIPVESLKWFNNIQEEYVGCEEHGIDVWAEKSNPLRLDVYWYPNKERYLLDFGFAGKEPFYEYSDTEGNLLLSLYYDEQTETGCGIFYYENRADYGFAFSERKEEEWEGARDYFAMETFYGDTEHDAEEYQEHYVYNDEGNIMHYESSGLYDIWGDGKERETILKIDFTYDENGRLKERSYCHNSHLFGTWYTSWKSFFDELGRVEYEYNYITHGTQYWFYIYEDDTKKPAYAIMVDPGFDLRFIRYRK